MTKPINMEQVAKLFEQSVNHFNNGDRKVKISYATFGASLCNSEKFDEWKLIVQVMDKETGVQELACKEIKSDITERKAQKLIDELITLANYRVLLASVRR